MFKWLRGVWVALAVLALPATASASDAHAPLRADVNWSVTYWNNTTLSGSPAVARAEATIDHNWGFGSPDYLLNADGFSARWLRRVAFTEGAYRFTATSDDGVRVWLDNELILNDWTTHPVRTVNATRNIGAGEHLLMVEYFEDIGRAQVQFAWQPLGPAVNNWRAEYFNNVTVTEPPAVVRDDANINFNWRDGSPVPGVIGSDNFSARWTRTLNLQAGSYRFRMATDDGGRLWVNNQLVMDYWTIQPAQPREATVFVSGGATPVRMEYFEATGDAAATLSWEFVNAPATFNNWRAEYYNNITLGGGPALVRDDAAINFNWRDGSPAPGVINAEGFSTRWTRSLSLPAGWYRFSMTVDDGGRLWVNDQPVIDEWRVQSQRSYEANVYVPGGSTSIRMEYFDQAGEAVARLSWAQSDATIRNWRGEYFNNTTFSGPPALLRDDAEINFNWAEGSPAPGSVNSDGFAVRWTRTLNLTAGRYRFVVTSDDGARLWVNDRQIVNAWGVQPATTNSADVDVPGGATQIRLEYFDNTGLASVRLAWAPLRPDPSISNWRGEYFNNTALTGAPVLVRDDADINFDWNVDSPALGVVGIDLFSVRWTRTLNLTAGWYRFTIFTDDGSRLFVNDRLVIDAWQTQVAQRYSVEVFASGATLVKLEYFEGSGVATARLTWEPIGETTRNWRGEYFNNPNLNSPAALVRDDAEINFNWGDNSPAPGAVNADLFSVRWTRNVDLPEGWYRFTLIVDDGGRLYIDDRLLIDAWRVQGPRPYDGEIYLSGGETSIRLEYFENNGWASVQLAWRDIPQATVPQTVIVDDTDAGFERNDANDWSTAPEGFGNRLTWSRNSDAVRDGTNTARWRVRLAPGRYEVFAFIPERYTTTSQARYIVSHEGGRVVRVVSQAANGNRWVSLGTYRFGGGDDDYVELSDVTFEPDRSLLVAFDAVRWEPR